MAERRKKDDIPDEGRSGADRRVIERLSNPRIFTEVKQIHFWVKGLAILMTVAAMFRLGWSLYQGAAAVFVQEFSNVVFMMIFAVLLFQYSRALSNYLKNESIANFEHATERQHIFWKSVGIFSFLFIVFSILFNL